MVNINQAMNPETQLIDAKTLSTPITNCGLDADGPTGSDARQCYFFRYIPKIS